MMRCKDPDLFAAYVAHAEISQNEVARRANMSRSFLSAVRHGQRPVDETDARLIARILDVRATALFEPIPRTRRRKASV